MTKRNNLSSDFKNYPFLTSEEFAEVCHYLERRYCQATLGPVRKKWKLRVCTALNTSFTLGPEYNTYIQIIRPLDENLDDGDLSKYLDNLSFDSNHQTGPETQADSEMIEAEEADQTSIVLPRTTPPALSGRAGYVQYEIHLHPTYQAPCLWFSLHDLPNNEPAFHIDTVFRRLVPDQYKDGLRNAAPIGGISADHHPVTGLPSFFVHPCLLGEAMSRFDCDKENYLMVWLGLVGGCVGLWVPAEMALQA
ncbi:hypothetical protein VTK26DRAFT_2551 [Humicola hyalothermophila]